MIEDPMEVVEFSKAHLERVMESTGKKLTQEELVTDIVYVYLTRWQIFKMCIKLMFILR